MAVFMERVIAETVIDLLYLLRINADINAYPDLPRRKGGSQLAFTKGRGRGA